MEKERRVLRLINTSVWRLAGVCGPSGKWESADASPDALQTVDRRFDQTLLQMDAGVRQAYMHATGPHKVACAQSGRPLTGRAPVVSRAL